MNCISCAQEIKDGRTENLTSSYCDFCWMHLAEEESKHRHVDDPVSPSHYKQGGIETWDYISSNNLDYLQGNVIKYVTRFRKKNGLEDLKKAKAYLDKLISIEETKK